MNAYSKDLRLKVLSAVERGVPRREILGVVRHLRLPTEAREPFGPKYCGRRHSLEEGWGLGAGSERRRQMSLRVWLLRARQPTTRPSLPTRKGAVHVAHADLVGHTPVRYAVHRRTYQPRADVA